MCRCLVAVIWVIALNSCAADAGSTGDRGSRTGSTTGNQFANAAGTGSQSVIPGGQAGTGSAPNLPPSGAAGTASGSGDDCVAAGAEAEVGREGADIVWIVDNSCSMAVEAVAVQSNMNRFAMQLFDRGIDVRLVLISSANTSYQMAPGCAPEDWVCILGGVVTAFVDFGVCIGAPFGSGTCPNDSKPPNFLHLPIPVGSTNGLQLALDMYPMYSQMLRPNASKHFAIVTDDDSDVSAADFTQRVSALDPTLFANWRYHGIFSFSDCPDSASVGTVHQALVQQTGGVAGDLCTQNFDPVFDELAMDVVMKAEIACDWAIPTPPPGETLDRDKINVNYTQPDGTVVALGRIPPGQACDGREGWHYDNEDAPTMVMSCPASCDRFKATGGKVDVLFGCRGMLVE